MGLTSNPDCIQVHQLRLEMHTADSTASVVVGGLPHGRGVGSYPWSKDNMVIEVDIMS